MLQSQFSSIKKQLLREFVPDVMCPLGNHRLEDTSNNVHQVILRTLINSLKRQ